MPLYEYQCAKCGRFELIQKFSDQPLSACPTCGQEVQKLLSAPAIQFKGTGWYITDYARKGGTGASSSGSDGGGGKSDGGKSDGGGKSGSEGAGSSGSDGGGKSSDSTSSPQTSTSKDSSASGSSSSK